MGVEGSGEIKLGDGKMQSTIGEGEDTEVTTERVREKKSQVEMMEVWDDGVFKEGEGMSTGERGKDLIVGGGEKSNEGRVIRKFKPKIERRCSSSFDDGDKSILSTGGKRKAVLEEDLISVKKVKVQDNMGKDIVLVEADNQPRREQ